MIDFAVELFIAGLIPTIVLLIGMLFAGWLFRIPGAPFQRGKSNGR